MTEPVVAVIGRPNVGKSTLANRLAERRGKGSIVGESPGLTRDRVEHPVVWRAKAFTLADTGGVPEEALDVKRASTLTGRVASMALRAVEESDLVLFVVDAQMGATSDELALAKKLRSSTVPVIVVANKVDDVSAEPATAELWSLGLGEPMPVSALHGTGSGDLLDAIVELLPESSRHEPEDIPSIAIVGRPNVGKSSLFNVFVGDERAIVHHESGTTRDWVDSLVEFGDRKYRFVDTAGLRRRAKTKGVDIYGASRTREATRAADIAILVVDASEGATSQDQRIAQDVAEAGVGALVALNKWDLVRDEEKVEEVEASVADRLQFISYAPMLRTSAITRRGVNKLFGEVDRVLAGRTIRVATARLNELVQEVQQHTPPPRLRNRQVKVQYATQVEKAPPTFIVFATGPLASSWLKFLERKLRETFGFTGNPIRIFARERRRGGQERRGQT